MHNVTVGHGTWASSSLNLHNTIYYSFIGTPRRRSIFGDVVSLVITRAFHSRHSCYLKQQKFDLGLACIKFLSVK